MKTPIPCTLLLAAPLAALAFLPGCVTEDNQGTRYSLASPGGYNTYAALPVDYTGDAYYYNNRYYAGGRYEPGTYSYQGRTYTNRYFYDGQYIYGGDYRQQPVSNSYGTPRGGASTSTRYVTYRELPRDYSGDAYYYNNRYYAGGRYEPGTYSYQGPVRKQGGFSGNSKKSIFTPTYRCDPGVFFSRLPIFQRLTNKIRT